MEITIIVWFWYQDFFFCKSKHFLETFLVRVKTDFVSFITLMVFDLVVQMFAGEMEMKLICLSLIYAFNSICSHVL